MHNNSVIFQTWCGVLQRAPQEAVAAAACPWLNVWLCLMMQPARVPIDCSLIVTAKANTVSIIVILYVFIRERSVTKLHCLWIWI